MWHGPPHIQIWITALALAAGRGRRRLSRWACEAAAPSRCAAAASRGDWPQPRSRRLAPLSVGIVREGMPSAPGRMI